MYYLISVSHNCVQPDCNELLLFEKHTEQVRVGLALIFKGETAERDVVQVLQPLEEGNLN